MFNYLNDEIADEDSLGRQAFADRVAKTIAATGDSSPLVISINGPWGSGKSTTLELLRKSLDRERVVECKFNAWRYHDEDALLKGFFRELAKALDANLLEGAEKIGEFVKSKLAGADAIIEQLAKIPGISAVAPFLTPLLTIGKSLQGPELDELRQRVRERLQEKRRRVVIFVDDPDRLDAEELFSLFRLIKLTANFPYVTFVLAMDYDAVTSAIGKRFGDPSEGKHFLEKIVQIPLNLPTVPRATLERLSLNAIQAVLDGQEIKLSEEDKQRFRSLFQENLMPLIRTPRMAKLYARTIDFSLGMLTCEINPVDVMLLEGVRLLLPQVFNNVIQSYSDFGIETPLSMGMSHEKDDQHTLLGSLLGPLLNETARQCAEALLQDLFPLQCATASHQNSSILFSMNRSKYENEQRVTIPQFFNRYLAASVPENDSSNAETDRFVALLESGSDVAKTALERKLASPAADVFISNVGKRVDDFNSVQAEAIVRAAAAVAEVHIDPTELHNWVLPAARSAALAAHSIRRIGDPEIAGALSVEVIRTAKSDLWAIHFLCNLPLYSLVKQKNEAGELAEKFFNMEVSGHIEEALIDRLFKRLRSQSLLPPPLELRSFFEVLSILAPAELREWSQVTMRKDQSFFGVIAEICLQRGQPISRSGRGKSIYFAWPGDAAVVKMAERLIDVEWLRMNLPDVPVVGISRDRHGITLEEAQFRLWKLLKNGGSQAHGDPACESAEGSQNGL